MMAGSSDKMIATKEQPKVELAKDSEFAMTEYKESCTAYFKGVDIGLSYMRYFFILNAALAAVMQIDGKAAERIGELQKLIPYGVPVIGILFCLMLVLIIPYYGRQLGVCADRCIEIEKLHGGDLFHKIKEQNDGPRIVTANSGLIIIGGIVGSLWFLAFPGVASLIGKLFQ
jgi:hypothetical protein